MELQNQLQELKKSFQNCLTNSSQKEEQKLFIKLSENYRKDLPSILNLFSLDQIQEEKMKENDIEKIYDNLREFLDDLIDQKIITEEQIINHFEEDLLFKLDFLEKQYYLKKKIQLYTKINFKQNKFNLLAENPEGYAIFLSKLFLTYQDFNYEQLNKSLMEIIGCYNLDTNKLIDQIIDLLRSLEIKENNAENIENVQLKFILNFLENSNQETIKKICQNRIKNLPEKSKSKSLLYVMAFLCKFGFLDQNEIWNNLKPKGEEFFEQMKQKLQICVSLIKDIFTVTIVQSEQEQEQKEKQLEDLKKKYYSDIETNHKLDFLEYLLKVNNFTDFWEIFQNIKIPFYFRKNDSFIYYIFEIYNELLNFWFEYEKNLKDATIIQQLNEKIKIQKKGFDFPKFIQNYQDNLKLYWQKSLQLISIIQTNISLNFESFQKTITFFSIIIKQNENYQNQFQEILSKFILPSIFIETLSEKQRAKFQKKISEILATLTYQQKYLIYQTTMNKYLLDNPLICNPTVIEKTKIFLASLSTGVQKQEFNQKKLKMLIEESPFLVMQILINEIKKYSTQINILIESMQTINDFSKDIIIFLFLNEFNCITLKKGDQMNKEFLNLSLFFAKFLKIFQNINLESIFDFILQKLSSLEGEDFLFIELLHQILKEFLGFEMMHHLNELQFKGALGGTALQVILFNFDLKFYQTSVPRYNLFQYLNQKEIIIKNQKFSLFWALYIKLCIQTNFFIYKMEGFSLKQNQQFIDNLEDVKQLLQILRKINLEEKVQDNIEESQINFVLENELNLLNKDVLTITRLMFRSNYLDINENNFKIFQKFIKQNYMNIFQPQNFSFKFLIGQQEIKELEIDENLIYFWYLSNEDFFMPENLYKKQLTKINNLVDITEKKRNEVKDIQKSELYKEELNLLNNNQNILQKEFSSYQNALQTLKIFTSQFMNGKKNISTLLIHQGIVQRFAASVQESFYSAKFLQILLKQQFDNSEQILEEIEKIISQLLPGLISFTENESKNFGNFIFFLLKINKYQQYKEFLQKVEKFDYFQLKKEKFDKPESFQQFQKILNQIFQNLIKQINKMFTMTQPTFAKNVLILLKQLLPIFPKNKDHCEFLLKMFENSKKFINEYSDLKLSCTNYEQNIKQLRENLEEKKVESNRQLSFIETETISKKSWRSIKNNQKNQKSPKSSHSKKNDHQQGGHWQNRMESDTNQSKKSGNKLEDKRSDYSRRNQGNNFYKNRKNY